MLAKWKLLIIGTALLLLSGCSEELEKAFDKNSGGNCTKEEVVIEGYGDKGKRLSNCFIEYPGEPTRNDKSYYIVEDICGQFTDEFVGRALGRTILKKEKSNMSDVFACSYFWNDRNEYVSIILDYLKIENQKAGQEALGRSVKEESQIPMKNMVVYQENELINTIYLILGENKFISIERSGSAGLDSRDLINFAVNLAKEIKNYK